MTRPQFVELEAWKADARANKASREVELRKGYAGVFKADDGDKGQIRIRITTGQRDRDRDTINPAGWRLDDYRKNPVVLFGHNYRDLDAVMGRDTGLTIDERGLVGTPVFASEDENPNAVRCERMIRGGFLNAASIGMMPVTWSYNEEERGVDFTEQSLLEYSIVPVPANPGALIEARSLGHDTKWIADWATKVLDEMHEGSGLWVPRAAIEGAYQEAKTGKLFGLSGIKALFAATDLLKAEDEGSGAGDSGGASGEGEGAGGTSGASSDPDPNAGQEPAAGDEIVIEVEVDEDDTTDDSDTLEIEADETEVRGIIRDAILTELGPTFTALTGRID